MTFQPRSNLTKANYHKHLPCTPRLIVLDLETTGFSPYSDHIIEVGALELVNLETRRAFHRMSKPPKALPEEIIKLTGIYPCDLADKPPPAEALREFLAWIGPQEDVTLVGHNIAFDMSFLDSELDRVNRDNGDCLALTRSTFCTLSFIKLAFCNRNLELERACRYFSVRRDRSGARHRALGDCELTQRLLVAMINWQLFVDSPGPSVPPPPLEDDPANYTLPPEDQRQPWADNK